MLNRRAFLAGILAATAAPAIVRAESLMRLQVPKGFTSTGLVLMPNGDPFGQRGYSNTVWRTLTQQYQRYGELLGDGQPISEADIPAEMARHYARNFDELQISIMHRELLKASRVYP